MACLVDAIAAASTLLWQPAQAEVGTAFEPCDLWQFLQSPLCAPAPPASAEWQLEQVACMLAAAKVWGRWQEAHTWCGAAPPLFTAVALSP